METAEYAPGRRVDLYGQPSHPTVLLWHGMQTDSRGALRPLAEMIADHDLMVIVPDWNSHAADGGRADLLGSLDFARRRSTDPDGLVLVGWSMGGIAAAGTTLTARRHGSSIGHTVCLAGAFDATDPISGGVVANVVASEPSSSFTLLHGLHDDVVPVTVSRTFAANLQGAGRRVELVELDADHGSIAGARYDAAGDRYEPSDDDATLAVAGGVAARIAAVLGH